MSSNNFMIYLPNVTHADRLNEVKSDMLTQGRPTIRVVEMGDAYFAIEGSHRLTAAHQLGILPIIKIVAEDSIQDHDYPDLDAEISALEIVKCSKYPIALKFNEEQHV